MQENTIRDSPILDLIHESLLLMDMECRITYWNRASSELYGWSERDVIGRPAIALLNEAPDADTENRLQILLNTGRWTGEVRRYANDRKPVLVDLCWTLQRDDTGAPVGIVETGRDLTDKRSSEEALLLSGRRYDNLFHAMAASFWELDFSEVGRVVRSLGIRNEQALRTHLLGDLGLVRQLVRSTRIVDVNDQTAFLFGDGDRSKIKETIDPYWPEESLPIFAESVVAAFCGSPSYAAETVLSTMGGRRFNAWFTACFPPESLASGLLTIGIIDISETRRAFEQLAHQEEKYRHLFDFMPIALWQLNASRVVSMFKGLVESGVADLGSYMDEHPQFIYQVMDEMIVENVNERAVQLWGASGPNELLGPVTKYWKENIGTFRRALEARFAGETFFQEETHFTTFDGRQIDALFTAARPGQEADRNLSIVGLIDITQRIQAQDELRRVQSEFTHSARVSLLGELSASIAHEVNQPLAAIATNAEAGQRWLNRPNPDMAEALKLMQRIVQDARRASEIVGGIRGMVQRKTPVFEPTSLNEVISDALLFLRHEFRSRGITVNVQFESRMVNVLADPTQIKQVVVNLVLNAMQAMSVQNANPVLGLRAEVVNKDWVACHVEDSGPGIPAELIDNVFESFVSTKENGMGIGLAICRTILQAHGGSIRAKNDSDLGGARFSFELPVA